MWEATKWIFVIITTVMIGYVFFVAMMAPSLTRACQEKYGTEWRAHFQGHNYCKNEAGELRAP